MNAAAEKDRDGTTDPAVGADLERVSREVEASVDEIAGFSNAQHARLVDEVVVLSADPRLWQGEGLWTMPAWLAWRAGVSPATAGQLVAIAERAHELPACLERFRRGELSLDQMAAVAKRAPSWTDRQVARLGANMTVRQLRRLLSTYPFPDEPERAGDEHPDGTSADTADSADSADTADTDTDTNGDTDCSGEAAGSDSDIDSADTTDEGVPRGPDEWCSWWWDDDGTLRFSGHADADTGAIIVAALSEARDELYRSRDEEVTWLDALREVAERSLEAVVDPGRRKRFAISVFIDTDDTTTMAGNRVTAAVQRHLTCDGELIPVMLENGLPLSVGRRQRIVPERTRRIVEHRDGYRCGVIGCEGRHSLEVHHPATTADSPPDRRRRAVTREGPSSG